MKNIYDTYTLSNGVKIPCVAYGTYKAKDENGADKEILKNINLEINERFVACFFD